MIVIPRILKLVLFV